MTRNIHINRNLLARRITVLPSNVIAYITSLEQQPPRRPVLAAPKRRHGTPSHHPPFVLRPSHNLHSSSDPIQAHAKKQITEGQLSSSAATKPTITTVNEQQ
ncbi:hypothetical protein CTRI78_v005306 [Colletotrichum trifolii]|uniref:Uncharacterized protein n=1 Tax=Colletotrichum trifolii TaxID=5466 RepID=A0A4R8RI49_COLTR|nr:hypothetical protein CTRI78_v005306 [Colletotrichum trifolii]